MEIHVPFDLLNIVEQCVNIVEQCGNGIIARNIGHPHTCI